MNINNSYTIVFRNGWWTVVSRGTYGFSIRFESKEAAAVLEYLDRLAGWIAAGPG